MTSEKRIHINVVADNIVSPLGLTPSENLDAVLGGRSGVSLHPSGTFGVPEPFAASLIDRVKMRGVLENEGIYEPEKYSFLEMISILSAKTALRGTSIDPSSDDVIFIFSSTKGNVAELEGIGADLSLRDACLDEKLPLASSARRISEWFGNRNTPVVISNACISGVCAEIEAVRLLRSGAFRFAVVIGADCQSRFIVSGFQSFRALSPEPCRPFDRDRRGLNLGEAAATVVLGAFGGEDRGECRGECRGERRAGDLREYRGGCRPGLETGGSGTERCGASALCWEILDGCIRNDANHISGPSRTGEGSYQALRYLLKDSELSSGTRSQDIFTRDSSAWTSLNQNGGVVAPEELALVNVHGTATAYNDEMESIALSRAGLSDVPVNSLKGFFGHTMGAAGVLETVLSMRAVERGLVLPTRGFENMGVSCPVNVSNELRHTDKRAFMKLISGFGGCNAAVAFRLNDTRRVVSVRANGCDEEVADAGSPVAEGGESSAAARLRVLGRIDISPTSISINGKPLEISDGGNNENSDSCDARAKSPSGHELLSAAYRTLGTDYPKFFKMDTLSRLGFVASELLLNRAEPGDRPASRQDRDVIFWNRSASLCNDRHYQKTISDPRNWFPSPSLFVYTLPNIVCGEIAIRNKWYGETMFFIADDYDESAILNAVRREFDDRGMNSALCGWLECSDDDVFEAHVFLLERDGAETDESGDMNILI